MDLFDPDVGRTRTARCYWTRWTSWTDGTNIIFLWEWVHYCLKWQSTVLTLLMFLSQGPPGLPGLKGDTGIKGEKVREASPSLILLLTALWLSLGMWLSSVWNTAVVIILHVQYIHWTLAGVADYEGVCSLQMCLVIKRLVSGSSWSHWTHRTSRRTGREGRQRAARSTGNYRT